MALSGLTSHEIDNYANMCIHSLTMGATVTILGASGYAGGELLRLLAQHPVLTPVAAGGHASAGAPVAEVHPHLTGVADGRFVPLAEAAAADADVCFSCLPSGELAPLVESVSARVVVDLADDHRADPAWAYGLPELNRAALDGATRVANPGCYPPRRCSAWCRRPPPV